jgi:hypothetical protein
MMRKILNLIWKKQNGRHGVIGDAAADLLNFIVKV